MNNTNFYFLYSFTLKYHRFVLCTCNVNGLTFQNSNTAATVKSAKKEEFYRTFIKIFRPKAVHFLELCSNEKVFKRAWCIWSSITQRSLIRFIQAKAGGFSIRSFAISATEQQPTFIIKSKQLLWLKLFKGTGQIEKVQFVGLYSSGFLGRP